MDGGQRGDRCLDRESPLAPALRPAPAQPVPPQVAYGISVWMQHWFHETLVYGWVNPYWRGLFKVYAGYGASYAASVPINAGLIWCRPDAVGAVLWAGAVVPWVTLVLTGVVNYFVFQRLLGGSDKPPATPRGLYNPGSDGGFTSGTDNPLTDVEQRLQPFGQGVNSPQGRKATKAAGQEVRRLRAQRDADLGHVDRFYIWLASL